MEKNAHINARLIDLLNILDMRTQITVFGYDPDGKQVALFGGTYPVYEIMTKVQNDRKLRNCEVVGINAGLVTNILVEKGE